MRWRALRSGCWLAAGVLLSCLFEPDLSRFPPCDEHGGCPAGSTCLPQADRCLPDCGERGPCLALEQEELAPGLEGAAYQHDFRARGGAPPYRFQVAAGSTLPPGLALDEQGKLSGTATVAGLFHFTLEVRDQGARPVRSVREYSLRVRPLLRLAGPAVLADAPVGEPYSERLSATGGTPPYHFRLAPSSSPPPDLTLSEDGRVTGTVQQSGTASFQVLVTDSDALPQEAARSLTLHTFFPQTLLNVKLTTRSVPDGRVGTDYTHTLQYAGARGSITWELKAGNFPPGIFLDTTTGTLSGNPSVKGASTFTLSISDMFTSDERTLSLQVD